ncbi:MAG: MltA domain-containing protein [Deltaproteobacteria bacterium]|nr:MltA domain-containing protein [Deltaproteobacteria bacterium]
MFSCNTGKRGFPFPAPPLMWVLTIGIALLSLSLLSGCHPTLTKEASRPEEALSRVRFFYPHFADDMDLDSLAAAVDRNLLYLERLPQDTVFSYGSATFICKQVMESQRALLDLLSQGKQARELNNAIRNLFWIYRATGRAGNNKVLFTGYFEPTFEARLIPDATFKYPLYRKPDDLIKIDLSRFRKKYKGESIVGRLAGDTIVPYYTRLQIEAQKVLGGRNLEIAWLKDPVDVAFLQIQGSGRLILPGGKSICVGYSSSNGQPYRSIGRYLLDNGLLEKEQMSMQSIRGFLATHPSLVQEILNYNPSYVFFRVLEKGPLGNIGVPLTPGRSIALDSRLFPKGSLAFISCQKPTIDETDTIVGWKKFSRFVLNQDTGGAIRGAGRADIFWGSGHYAEIAAGHLKHEGELYFLIKKP